MKQFSNFFKNPNIYIYPLIFAIGFTYGAYRFSLRAAIITSLVMFGISLLVALLMMFILRLK